MKAYVIDEFTGIDAVHLADIPKPVPGEDEVLIRLTHASINPIDWKITDGYLKEKMPYENPITLGWDAAGVVEQVGKDVGQLDVGDQVYAYARKEVVHDGTFSEYIALKGSAVAHRPQTVELSRAAAVPLAGLTAWQSLMEVGGLKSGERVLVHAGAGGVGGYAIQFAKHFGAHVITTASSRNHDYVRRLGADQVIDYTTCDFTEHCEPVDLVFDCAGGETLTHSFSVVKKGGRLVSIVAVPDENLAKEHQITAAWHLVYPNGEQLAAIARLIDGGVVQLPDIQVMSFDQIPEALRLSKERHVRGKIVIDLNA